MTWEVIPVAAIVSAIVTVLLRFFDRPQARLVLEAKFIRTDEDGSAARRIAMPVSITNVGDGDALDLEVFGHLCDPATVAQTGQRDTWVTVVPVVRSGDSVTFYVGLAFEPETRPQVVRDARLLITWTAGHRTIFGIPIRPRRQMLVRLEQIPFETLLGPALVSPGTLPPRFFRSRRRLRRRSPRAHDELPF